MIAVGSTLPVLFLSEIQEARGFYLIALLNGMFYTTLIVVIYFMHARESAQSQLLTVVNLRSNLAWSACLAAVILIPLAALPLRLPAGLAAILEGAQILSLSSS